MLHHSTILGADVTMMVLFCCCIKTTHNIVLKQNYHFLIGRAGIAHVSQKYFYKRCLCKSNTSDTHCAPSKTEVLKINPLALTCEIRDQKHTKSKGWAVLRQRPSYVSSRSFRERKACFRDWRWCIYNYWDGVTGVGKGTWRALVQHQSRVRRDTVTFYLTIY